MAVNEGVFPLNFLIEANGKNATDAWPTPAIIEAVDSDQVFIRNLEVTEANKILRFQQMKEIMKQFPHCQDRLIRRQIKAQVFHPGSKLSGDVPYLLVYKSTFYDQKISPKLRPRLIHESYIKT